MKDEIFKNIKSNNKETNSLSKKIKFSLEKKGDKNYLQILNKKTLRYKVDKRRYKNKYIKEISKKRWIKDDCEKFLEQKFYKQLKNYKNNNLGIDFTLETVNNINDMFNQLKALNYNENILILKYILKKKWK